MADGDDEVLPEKDVDLTELHPLHLVEVGGRLEYDEERPAVALQLGPLVGVQRVLHRQRVKLELLGHGLELFGRRLVQLDPRDGLLAAARLVGLVQGGGLGGPMAVHVDGAVHDHGRH